MSLKKLPCLDLSELTSVLKNQPSPDLSGLTPVVSEKEAFKGLAIFFAPLPEFVEREIVRPCSDNSQP